jgi:hypothetical protein
LKEGKIINKEKSKMDNSITKITIPQIQRFYHLDGTYYDIQLGEICIANNNREVYEILEFLGIIWIGAIILFALKS